MLCLFSMPYRIPGWTSGTRLSWLLFLVMVGLTTCFAVFLLPYQFPPTAFVLSASYIAGFSNRVAAIAAALISIIVFLISPKGTAVANRVQDPGQERIPRRYLWITLGIFLLCEGAIAVCVHASPHAYGEEVYGLDRFYQLAVLHRVPLRDFEFGYGPILVYIPMLVKAVTSPFHIDLEASYLIAVTCMHLGGICLLFYIVNRIIPGRRYKTAAFLIIAFSSLNVDLGLQYTGLRFLGPFAALLAVTEIRKVWQAALFLSLTGTLIVFISPEMGVAFVCGACTYCFLRAREQGISWIAAGFASCLGLVLAYAAFGAAVVRTASAVAAGALNFVVVPVPHILYFLAAVVFIVPIGLASFWTNDKGQTPLFSALCGIYVLSLVLIPPALGRCDGGHVLWQGLGFFLLSLLFAGAYSRRGRLVWILSFAAIYLVEYYSHTRIMYGRAMVEAGKSGIQTYLPVTLAQQLTAKADRYVKQTSPAITAIDPLVFRAEISNGSLAMPLQLDKQSEYFVKSLSGYQPNYFAGLNFVASAKDEDIIIAEVNHADWVVLPSSISLPVQDIQAVRAVFQYPIFYPEIRDEYHSGLRMVNHVRNSFVKIRECGSYTLYRNPAKKVHASTEGPGS